MLYFAYGSNMDPAQMSDRCPGAEPIGIARILDHRVAFVNDEGGFDGGVATVVAADSTDVWGVLWEIDETHLAALDEWEWYPEAYRRHLCTVVTDREPVHRVIVYEATSSTPESPQPDYLEGILRGAEEFGLPEQYIRRLQRWAH